MRFGTFFSFFILAFFSLGLISCKLDDNSIKGQLGGSPSIENPSVPFPPSDPSPPSSVDDGVASTTDSTPVIEWTASSDFDSETFDRYEFSIGTSPGATDEFSWTSNGSSTRLHLNSLSLSLNQDYFVNVKVVDQSGRESTVVSSDGWKVVESVAVSPGQVTFANWNDYYQKSTPTNSCLGTEPNITDCIHGGEKKVVDIPSLPSCTGLSGKDSADAFYWTCDDGGGHAVFSSVTLKPTRGLQDFIQDGTWRKLQMIIYSGGTPVKVSSPLEWWTNTLSPLPENSQSTDPIISLTTVGTIYYLEQSRATSGYNINGDSIGVVTLKGATLSGSGTSSICFGASPCLVKITTGKHIWVEGVYSLNLSSGSPPEIGIVGFSSEFSNFRNIMVFGSGLLGYGIHLVNSVTRSYFTEIRISNMIGGLYFLNGSHDNVVSRINMSQISTALSTGNPTQNLSISQVVISGASIRALDMAGARDSFVNGATITNVIGSAIEFMTGDQNTTNQFVAFNGATGISTGSADDLTFSQIVLDETAIGLQSLMSNNGKFTGLMALGNHSDQDCSIVISGDPGFVDPTCANSGFSDATILTGTDLSNSFNGPLSLDDSINASDQSGQRLFEEISDWLNFDHFFRSWGKGGVAFPNSALQGKCQAGDTCNIYDWGLSLTDTVLRNKSNDGVSANAPFVAGSPCPPAVHGNNVGINRQTVPLTYLLNAVEIIKDDIGNDNSLCESNEFCIYMPNFGADQGDGDFYEGGQCTFQNGSVSNVKMYAYP